MNTAATTRRPCRSTHHSADAALRHLAILVGGPTCTTCRGTGEVEVCNRCLAIGCTDCPACLHCDDTQQAGCPACEGAGVHADDSECRPCRGKGKARCWRC